MVLLIKSTIYCSKCGKGNVIDSPLEGIRFRCVNCNELNQVQARKPADEGAKRLKEVYHQRSQQTGAAPNMQSRVASFRYKKTLVDKNIDLLEKVEAMEKESLELKNEYLEMTHQLSIHENNPPPQVDNDQLKQIKTEIEKVSEMGGKLSGLEDIKEILLNIQTEPTKALDFSELKEFLQKIINTESEKIASIGQQISEFAEIKNAISKLQSEPANMPDISEVKDIFQKEFKSIQHVLNTIAGEVRVLRKEIDDVTRKINSGQVNMGSSANQQQQTSLGDSNIAPEKTTQFLAVPENEENRGEPKSPSTGKKGSKSFKAVSDKLKSLKL